MPSFSNPWWLLLTPPLLFLIWKIGKNSYAEGSIQRHRFWFFLRSFILFLLLAALAGLHWKTPVSRKQVLFLMDVSDSISAEQKQLAVRHVNNVIQKLRSPDQTGIILFGTTAVIERFPGTPRLLERTESSTDYSETNIQEAIHLSEALFAPGYQKNIVLITDGNETAGNMSEAVTVAKEHGVTIQALYLLPGNYAEAAVENVRVPEQIGLKENFALDVLLSSNRNTPSLLQVYRNGVLIQEGTLQLNKDQKELIRLPQKITEPGVYRYEIRLKPGEDYQSTNNGKEIWVAIQGPPRLLLADSNLYELRPLASALTNRGFQINLTDMSGFPLSMHEMLQYQAIFVRNIPASNLQRQMPLLKQYVHDFGGGLIMLGGKNSFGPGGYYKTPIEETLPVSMDLINKKYLADVAMVIVIDKSGSMSFADRGRQKIDLADEGGARVASLLKDTDQLGVLAVDSVPKWAFQLQRLGQKQQAIDAITSIRAGGGGIYVYSGLREAYDALQKAESSVKHVILFADTADCEEKDGPYGESSLAIAQRMLRDFRITTTTIGIGQNGDIDVPFLEQVAIAGEGRFYFTNDMFTLPEIFSQESALVQRYYINEQQFTPRMGETEPVLSGIDVIPDLLGYVATSIKPAASMAIVSQREDPVLAFWRYGLGNSAAFTSDPTAAWGKLWLGWTGYERFWAQLSRWLAHSPLPPNFETHLEPSSDSTILIVEAIDAEGHLISDTSFQAVFLDSTGTQQNLKLSQTAPGRYEAKISGRGSLIGKVFREGNGKIVEEQIVHYAGNPNRELASDTRGRLLLQKIIPQTYDSPESLRFKELSSFETQPLRNQLLWLAAILFLLDVAARKIDFERLKPARSAQPAQSVAGLTPLNKLKSVKIPRQEIAMPIETLNLQNEPSETEAKSPEPVPTSEYLERLKKAKRRE